MVTTELMNYFKFDEADLTANKIGQLTDKQKARLRGDAKSSRKWGLIAGLFFFGIASIFPLAFFGPCVFSGECEKNLAGLIAEAVAVLIWIIAWGGIGVVL